ncbi:hypothetical protein EGH25_00145 [Haladaptatus sp. F3-133]|uniref:Uncharacterized protein n=1 Tax=Halorutilus salinus TaxID=2487751 RepID=A0A9Q4GGI5_9EURY|nr:hypothetical protein [Halorutilus salinus]MCX2817775.1 hypothetical protein [Halorutilus salinus]
MNDRLYRVTLILSVFALIGAAGAGVVAAQDATVGNTTQGDDYDSLQNAIDGEAAGSTIQVNDSYDSSADTFPITVSNDLTINGTANAEIVAQTGDVPDRDGVINQNGGTLNVEDVRIEVNLDADSKIIRGIDSSSGELNVDNVVFDSSDASFGFPQNNYTQLVNFQSGNGSVTNSEFNGEFGDAIQVRTTDPVTVDNNDFNGVDSSEGIGVNANAEDGHDNVTVTNNNFDTLGGPVTDFNSPPANADGLQVSGNTITNSDGLGDRSSISVAGLNSQFDIDSVDPAGADSTINVGTNETYNVTVTNSGADQDAKNVSVEVDVPGGTNLTATEDLVLNAGETDNVTLELDTSGLDADTYNVSVRTNDSNDDEVTGDLTVSDPDARNFIDGNIGDDQLNPIDNAGDVEINVTYIGGSGTRATDFTLISQVQISELDDIQDIIDDPLDNRVDDSVGDAGYNPTAPDQRDEYFINLPNFGDGTQFNVEADLEGFGAFDGPTTPPVGPGGQAVRDIRLERLINADEIDIDKTPADGRVDLGGTITDNVTVLTNDTEPADELEPLSDTPVNVTVVDSTTGEFPGAISEGDLVITPVPPANTGSNGTVEFQISLNQSGINAEAIDGGVDFTLEFEATASGDGPAVTQQQNITFVGEPPTGDGTIAGDVEEIVTDGASNTESADGVSVHAVNTDRVDSNTHGFNTSGGPATVETWVTADEERTTPESVPGEGNDYGEYFRVAELNTDGTVAEILDVRTDYLVSPSTNAYSQNLSMPGTGFTSDSTSDVGVAPLEPGDYQIQYSTDGSFDSPDLSNFTATANLTYEFTEQRYNGSAAVHTDVTRDDGTYELYNLFTNADADTNSDAGQTYVTIAADDTTALGFANFRGYDTVDVQQNSDAGGADDDTGQLETDLSVFEVPVQPDSVNVTNIGTVSSPADADANFSQDLSAFADTSDNTRQAIPRDGSTVDVIELRTFAEEGDVSVGADATVSFSETDVPETFAGSFLADGVGGDVSVNSDDQITVDTSPEEGSYEAGEAVIFLRSDSAGLDDDANLTVEADLSGLDTDTTDKLFEGVLSQKYESASITGVVTDDNDNPVDARIFVSEFVDEGAGIEITFVPDDVEDLNNFTATVSQIGGPTLETVDLTAEDMQEFEFQGFGSNLSLAAGEEPYQLLADRAADRTTLSPVPAVPDAQLGPTEDVTYALRGVSAQGQTGTSVSTAVEVNRTSTASVVIDAIETEYQLSNLNPTDATIQQGDDLTVTAEVTNSGDFADNQSVTLEVENEAGDVTEIASQSVELSADASTTVTFTAENVDLAPGNYTHAVASEDSRVEGNLTVEEAPDEANFEVSNLDPADATVTEGADPINVTADVENTGDLSGTQNVTLEVTNASGEVVYSDTVSTELDAGNSTTVEFTGVQAGDLAPGDYTHAVASDDSSVEGNLTVEEAPDPANFGVSNLVPSGATVTEGDDPINVTADVENTGDLSGTQNVTLEVTNASGEVVYDEEESVEVDGGNTTTVEFTGVPAGDLTPGEYTHAVASEDSSVEGNLTVEAVDDGNGGNGDGSAPSDNPLFDESGEPMDGLDVTDALTTWTETGEINGEPVEGLDLIDYLSDWNEAQSGN